MEAHRSKLTTLVIALADAHEALQAAEVRQSNLEMAAKQTARMGDESAARAYLTEALEAQMETLQALAMYVERRLALFHAGEEQLKADLEAASRG